MFTVSIILHPWVHRRVTASSIYYRFLCRSGKGSQQPVPGDWNLVPGTCRVNSDWYEFMRLVEGRLVLSNVACPFVCTVHATIKDQIGLLPRPISSCVVFEHYRKLDSPFMWSYVRLVEGSGPWVSATCPCLLLVPSCVPTLTASGTQLSPVYSEFPSLKQSMIRSFFLKSWDWSKRNEGWGEGRTQRICNTLLTSGRANGQYWGAGSWWS